MVKKKQPISMKNKIYKNNQTPEIILNKVQAIVEKKTGKGATWFDACPFHCPRDNLNHKSWPTDKSECKEMDERSDRIYEKWW